MSLQFFTIKKHTSGDTGDCTSTCGGQGADGEGAGVSDFMPLCDGPMVIDSRIVVTVNIADKLNSKCYTLMMTIVIVRIPI